MRFAQIVVFIILLGCSTWAATVEVDGDGALRVDGERRFVLGMYDIPQDDAFAAELAQAGFNLVRCSNNQESLDRAQQNGLGAWLNLGGHVRVKNNEGADGLKKSIVPVMDHSAMWVWEVPDEDLWNLWYPKTQQVFQRWDQMRETMKKAELPEAERQELEEWYTHFRTYRDSARFEEAEAEERRIRAALELPMDYAPLLSSWYEEVEPLRAATEQGCRIVRQTDGKHPIWFNHAPRNTIADLRLFGEIADIAGCDIYPVGHSHSDIVYRNLSATGEYTRRMAAGAPGKAVWMVLQGFSWDDLFKDQKKGEPRPSFDQTRYMGYDAIVNGARGILYWGTAYIEKDSAFWSDLKRYVRELADLEPFLAARDAGLPLLINLDPTASSVDQQVLTLSRKVGDRYMILLVNENNANLAFTLHGLDELEGRTLKVMNSWEELTVENGQIRFGLPHENCAVLLTE